MNSRAEKRREARKNDKTPTYNFNKEQLESIVQDKTQRDIQRAKEEATQDALNFAANGMIAAFSLALHDHFGFGNRRLRKLMDKVNRIFDALDYDGADMSIDDLLNLCKEVTGIDVKSEVGG
ncbi:MAG: hypothetical protein HF312_17285 [Ignavibacteria bacterium]|nr:hypothetical protein [Ignavibacteria bacterium]